MRVRELGRIARVAVVVLTLVAFGTATTAAGGASQPAASGGSLGTKDPAKGATVKVGVITNGKTPTIDNSQEIPVAQATAQWINDYHAGLGGHPIQIGRAH